MTSPRSMRALAIAGLVGNAAYWILQIVTRSGNPGRYYQFRNSPEGFVYPTADVASWAIAVAVEAVGASLVLAWVRHVTATCALLATLAGAAMFGFGALAMHAPPYYGLHVVSLFFAAVWLAVAAIVTGIGRWYGPRDGRT